MAFLDVDGDGLDEWIWGKLNSLIAMKWTGTTFSQLWEVPVLGGAQIIKIQNIDADSAKEIIVVNNGAIKVFNSLTHVLKWETPNWSVTALDIVDMDNDKKVDLFIGNQNGVFQFRLQDTVFTRSFVTHTADLLPTKPQLIEKLYPNPATDKLTINLNPQLNQPFIWRIYDINGQLIISESTPSVSKAILSIPVQNLSSGVYLFQIQTENAIENCRFVVANKM